MWPRYNGKRWIFLISTAIIALNGLLLWLAWSVDLMDIPNHVNCTADQDYFRNVLAASQNLFMSRGGLIFALFMSGASFMLINYRYTCSRRADMNIICFVLQIFSAFNVFLMLGVFFIDFQRGKKLLLPYWFGIPCPHVLLAIDINVIKVATAYIFIFLMFCLSVLNFYVATVIRRGIEHLERVVTAELFDKMAASYRHESTVGLPSNHPTMEDRIELMYRDPTHDSRESSIISEYEPDAEQIESDLLMPAGESAATIADVISYLERAGNENYLGRLPGESDEENEDSPLPTFD